LRRGAEDRCATGDVIIAPHNPVVRHSVIILPPLATTLSQDSSSFTYTCPPIFNR
jgi:hypothetical protein